MKIISARANFVHVSPQKVRLVADAVRSLNPDKAIDILKSLNQKAAQPLLLVFKQAVANAKNNFQLSPGNLKVNSLQIQEGPRGPKRTDRSHGARFDRGVRRSRTSHIILHLTENGSKS